MIAATSSPQALWYLSRGTGLVALFLLTAGLVLGITEVTRWTSRRFPRFVTAALHKNVSLLAVVFLGIHVVTAIADGFAPIGWLDVVIPFGSSYRPLWLGLGAVAVDLLVAVIVTSIMRTRIGHRAWRAVHWISYACWPAALLHGLGTGSDTRVKWSLLFSLTMLALVVVAVLWRLIAVRGVPVATRAWAGVASGVAVVALLAWTFTGPTRPGWARRAGTPASLLVSPARRAAGDPASTFHVPFDAFLAGTIHESPAGRGRTAVTIDGSLSNGRGSVRVTLVGTALEGGGVRMDHGDVEIGPVAEPTLYRGAVDALVGTDIQASVRDGHGDALDLDVSLDVDSAANTVTGRLTARAGDS